MTLCSCSCTIQLFPPQVISFSLSDMELRKLHLKGKPQVRIPNAHNQLLFTDMIVQRPRLPAQSQEKQQRLQPESRPQTPNSRAAGLSSSRSQGDSNKTSITSCPSSPITVDHFQAPWELALGYCQPPILLHSSTTVQPHLLLCWILKYAHLLPAPLHFFPNSSFFLHFSIQLKKSILVSLKEKTTK